VFEPYTPIASNLLFFDTTGPTGDIHYWAHPVPDGRKKYSKTASLQSADLADLVAWWDVRGEDARSWVVNGPALIERDADGVVRAVNLDQKNPNAKAVEDHRAPSEIVAVALAKEREVLAILEELHTLLAERDAA
jgi:type I restriction enzyme M protein